VLGPGAVGRHVGCRGMGLQRLEALPLLDHDEAVGADLGLEAAHLGVDRRAVLDAALLRADRRDDRAELLQQRVALARLGGDVGEDVNHDGGSSDPIVRGTEYHVALLRRRHPGAERSTRSSRSLRFWPRMPPSIPLVRAITIERLPDLLDRMNVRLDVLMRRAGLPEVPFDQHGDFLPLREVLAVVEGAARATGIEHIGLLLATTGGLEKIGDYGRHMAEAPTLLEAIRRAARYISWHTLGARLALIAEGEGCVWRYSFPRTVRDHRQHGYPFSLVMMRDIVRLAVGLLWT